MSYADDDIKKNDKYLRMSPGDTVRIHILAKNPKMEFVHWFDDKSHLTCSGQGCKFCVTGQKPPRQTWHTNILDRGDGKVKNWTIGPMIRGQIRDIAEALLSSNVTIHQVDLQVKCKKEGQKTSYSTVQIPKAPGEEAYLENYDENAAAGGDTEVPF